MFECKLMLVMVELCIGGFIVKVFIDLFGSLVWFDVGVVIYSYEVKEVLLGVNFCMFECIGVVSEEIVLEMVFGVLVCFGVGVVVVVIGIVGLFGGIEGKLVGIVWIGWKCCGGYVYVCLFYF